MMCTTPESTEAEDQGGFHFSLVAADGTLVGECCAERPLAPGDLITVPPTNDVWCIDSTLGSIAQVRPPADGEAALVRISASTAAGAYALAAELGVRACCGETPNGWVLYIRVADAGRVATLATVAAAARRIEAAGDSTEFFVVDQGRPVRFPPSL